MGYSEKIGLEHFMSLDFLGDFNNVFLTEEKNGGLKVTNYETNDFVDCVASVDLIDLKYVGCFFTWMSPKFCSKLDRVMVNNA